IAVPAGLDANGLPLGLQLIGRPFDEEMLFRTAAVVEKAAGRVEPTKWWRSANRLWSPDGRAGCTAQAADQADRGTGKRSVRIVARALGRHHQGGPREDSRDRRRIRNGSAWSGLTAMFYYLAKIFWLVAEPVSLIAVMLAAGLGAPAHGWRRRGCGGTAAPLCITVVTG